MKIDIETKYKIGQDLYYLRKEVISGTGYDAYIYKVTIQSIQIIDYFGNYVYETNKGCLFENQFFEKLNQVKEYAKTQGYKEVKYIS